MTIIDLLNNIFIGDEVGKKTVSIPKIIFVDTCHGTARNHLDVFCSQEPDVSKNLAKNENPNKKPRLPAQPGAEPKPCAGEISKSPPPAGGFNQQQRLENFIILHASVQQNFSWQSNRGSCFLDGLC